MGISSSPVNESTNAASPVGATVTVTINATTAGNLLALCFSNFNDNIYTIGSVSGGGTWVLANQDNDNNATQDAEIWVCPNCSGGVTSVVITFAGGSTPSATNYVYNVTEWSGAALSSVTDQAPAATVDHSGTAGTALAPSITPTQTGELILGIVSTDGSVGLTGTIGGGFTNLTSLLVDVAFAYRIATTGPFQYTQGIGGTASYSGTAASFFPSGAPPTVVTGAAAGVMPTTAKLQSTVNPNGLSTTYAFNWGTTSGYGNTTIAQSAGAGGSAIECDLTELQGLTPGTVYHFRVTATNASGTTNGSDAMFTTTAEGAVNAQYDGDDSWFFGGPRPFNFVFARTYDDSGSAATPITDSDTGSGADAGESISAPTSDSQTGSGADTGESLTVSLSDSETASGLDAGEALSLADSETGGGVDAGEALATSDAETGAGVDAGESLAVALTDSDAGSGLDNPATTGLTDTETASGLDAGESLVVALSDSETGSGTDAGESIVIPITDSETGTGTDAGESVFTGNPAISTLIDNFPGTSFSASWTGSGTVGSNEVTLPCGGGYPSFWSTGQYDLTGSSITVHIVPPAVGDGTPQIEFNLSQTSGGFQGSNGLEWNITDGGAFAELTQGGSQGFPAGGQTTSGGYFRIRESAGTIFWDYSTDGISWGNVASSTYSIAITALFVGFDCGFFGADPSSQAEISQVNILTASITDSETGSGTDAGETLTVAFSDSETGGGVDAGESIAASTSDAETATTGLDAGEALALSDIESGSGADTGEALALADVEVGSGLDSGESVAVALSDTDAATGVDAGESVNTGTNVSDTETGSGLDSGESLSVAITDSETASGLDAGEIVNQTLTDTDTGSGLDGSEAIVVQVTDSETASGIDGGEALALTDTETGSGTDTATLIALSDADIASMLDAAAAFLASVADTELGTFIDAGEFIPHPDVPTFAVAGLPQTRWTIGIAQTRWRVHDPSSSWGISAPTSRWNVYPATTATKEGP